MKRHILSIDGGGVRGIVAAVLLDALEGEIRAAGSGRPLCDHFDLIAGTSTGAIIAAGLAAPGGGGDGPRRTPAALRDLYRNRAREIFPLRFWCRLPVIGRIRQFFGPLYKAASLEHVLAEEIGACEFGGVRRNLFITAYSIDPREPAFFRGGPAYAARGEAGEHGDIRLIDAIVGSAAAPTFFPPKQISSASAGMTRTVIDGGVFINDPALAAYAEALTLFPGDEIHVVSIGCGRLIQPYPFAEAKGWGFLEWLSPVGPFRTPLLSAIADGQTRAVAAQMTTLLGPRYHRFDYDLASGYGSPDIDNASRRNLRRLEKGALKMVEELRPRLKAVAAEFA